MQSAGLGLVKMLRKNKDRTKLKRKGEYNIQREGTRTNIRREKKKKEERRTNLHNLITFKGELVLCIHPHFFLMSKRRNAPGQIVPNANGF